MAAYDMIINAILWIAIPCFFITYAIIILLSTDKPKPDIARIQLFFNCMTFSDVIYSLVNSLLVWIVAVFLKPGENICTKAKPQDVPFSNYIQVFAWQISVFVLLRNVIAIPWLHDITDVKQLVKLLRGLSKFALSCVLFGVFIFLLNNTGESYSLHQQEEESLITICHQDLSPYLTDFTNHIILVLTNVCGYILAHSIGKYTFRPLSYIVLFCVFGHFLPNYALSFCISEHLKDLGYQDVFPVIYILVSFGDSVLNRISYSLCSFAESNSNNSYVSEESKDSNMCEDNKLSRKTQH